ncbi:MAG: TatD family deoxyribonuclease [Alphaproteobacteria bacterium]|nr:MAG: TatD family deoxyribonuclease [Alphaproteobacteria bacterium]
MIDFHCHLDLYPDPHKVAEECRRQGIYVLSVTTTPSAWNGTQALSNGTDRIRTALGLHPQLAHERQSELQLFDRILAATRYVGEVGLDGSPELRPHWKAQVAVFEHVLRECQQAGGRVLSIHSRRAAKEVLDRLESSPGSGTPILHWFSGSMSDLERAISLGCWFSVGPAMLASQKGRALAAKMPRNRILTESDGPFARIGHTSLMPWQAADAAAGFAKLWSVSTTDAEKAIASNFRNLTRTFDARVSSGTVA